MVGEGVMRRGGGEVGGICWVGVRAGLRQQSALPETAERCVLARRMVYGTEAYGVAVSGGGQLRISELLAAKADCGSAG
ncbi:hypothetical protein V1478_011785 [Vespula squamosa]|uniref:Uncharacterized protein n=1 Tax=Vespula squamosa TaxID=30214 RepID=A0ABD2ABC8_VESSQ